MIKGRLVSLVVILLFLATSLNAQDEKRLVLSLEQALEMAGTQNYQARIANVQVKHAQGQNLESWGGFLPHVSISENYLKSSDPVNVFMMKLKQGVFTEADFSVDRLNDPDDFDNYTTLLMVKQPILNLDAIYGKSAASLGVQASKEAAKRTGETVTLHVKKAYFGLILARQNLLAIDEAVASAQSHRDNARIAFEQGLINRADYLAAEVRLSELQEQRISAQHQVANAGDALRFILVIPEAAEIVPTDSLGWPQETNVQGNIIGLQVAQRSDLRALQLQTKAAHRSLWMKRSGWIPHINALGAFEWNASDVFQADVSSWTVGVQLEWQLFDGLGHFGRSKQAAAEREQATIRYEQAEEQAKLEVRKAERAVQSATQRIEVAKAAVEQAQESLRIVEARFEQGLEKTSDVLDKEVSFTRAKLRLLKARHDFNVAHSEFDYALGR